MSTHQAIRVIDEHAELAGLEADDHPQYLNAARLAAALGQVGATGDKTYRHVQHVPAAVWTISHGMGKRPAITVRASDNTIVEGGRTDPDLATTILTFSAAFAGEADCN